MKKPVKIVIGVVGTLAFFVLFYKACGGDSYREAKRLSAESNEKHYMYDDKGNVMKDENGDPLIDEYYGLTDEEKEIKQREDRFGNSDEGFTWNDEGELVAVGDENKTMEDVIYAYLRGASMLDLETVSKNSLNSKVVSTYKGYYDDADYATMFKRKIYKEVLKSMVVDGVEDSSILADGTAVITMKIEVLDLTDKDFWKPDTEEIYKNLKAYYRTESDQTKAKQYVYDYIINWYSSDKAPKKNVLLEFVLTKQSNGAWLVTNDDDLNILCKYEDGELVSNFILSSYSDWMDTQE